MKNRILLIALAGMALVSCSDDKSDCLACLPEISGKEYSGSELEVYYMGEVMPGKQVTVSVDKNAGKAKLVFSSTLNLDGITGMGLTGKIEGPGIIPGERITTLEVPVSAGDGRYVFAGAGTDRNISYSYSGSISEEKTVLSLTDCKLANASLAGVFAPAPIKKEGLSYTSLPIHLVWELDPSAGIDIPLSDILKAIVVTPVIPVYGGTAYMSVAQGFESVVKTIALTESGNIPVMYISTLGGAAHLATTSGNMLQYLPAQGGLKLYVNPLSVFGEFLLATSNNKNDEKFDFEAMLKKTPALRADAGTDSDSATLDPAMTKALLEVLLKTLAPQIAEGVPLAVAPTTSGADIYFDTATSVEFLASLIGNALQNPEIMKALMSGLGQTSLPEGVTVTDVLKLLQTIPDYLEKTTKLEIGLSLVKAQ